MKKSWTILGMMGILAALLLTSCGGSTINVSAAPGVVVNASSDAYYIANGYFVYSVPIGETQKYWHYPSEQDSTKVFYSSPAISQDGNLLVVGSWYPTSDQKFGLYGIDITSAKDQIVNEAWESPFLEATGRWIASPIICGEYIYAANTDQTIYVLDIEGKLVGSYNRESYASEFGMVPDQLNMGAYWAQPACDEENVYITNLNHVLFALKQGSTPSKAWSRFPDLEAAVVTSPFIHPETADIYIGNINGILFQIDASSGTILNKVQFDGGIWSKPVVVGENLYIATATGMVYKISKGLEILDSWYLESPVISTGVVYENSVYFMTRNGTPWRIDASGFHNPLDSTGIGGEFVSDLALAGNYMLAPIKGGTEWMFLFNFKTSQPSTFTP